MTFAGASPARRTVNIRFQTRYIATKFFWFFGNPARRVYAFLFRPTRRTAKVLVKNSEKVLLVRPNYSHRRWTLPGGKVERNESFEEGATREVHEETGLHVQSLTFIGEYRNVWQYYENTVKYFLGSVSTTDVEVDGVEISEAKWFRIDALPNDRSAGVDRSVELYNRSNRD